MEIDGNPVLDFANILKKTPNVKCLDIKSDVLNADWFNTPFSPSTHLRSICQLRRNDPSEKYETDLASIRNWIEHTNLAEFEFELGAIQLDSKAEFVQFIQSVNLSSISLRVEFQEDLSRVVAPAIEQIPTKVKL